MPRRKKIIKSYDRGRLRLVRSGTYAGGEVLGREVGECAGILRPEELELRGAIADKEVPDVVLAFRGLGCGVSQECGDQLSDGGRREGCLVIGLRVVVFLTPLCIHPGLVGSRIDLVVR